MVKLSAGEKKKMLIVDVCKKLFYRKGYANTTYDDICREADIPPGTITYHFGGKRDIAATIDAEYERENKTYMEKLCGDRYTLTQMMVLENIHMWKRILEDANIRRFLLEIEAEHIPDVSSIDVIIHFYRCVMEDLGIENIDAKELDLIASAQEGMSGGLIHALAYSGNEYSCDELSRFAIRFFFRQLGLSDEFSEEQVAWGLEEFKKLPIDNRYYEDFAYDDRFVTALEG